MYCIKYKSSTFYLEHSISDDLNYKKLKSLIDIDICDARFANVNVNQGL